jgi:hypothetical protein
MLRALLVREATDYQYVSPSCHLHYLSKLHLADVILREAESLAPKELTRQLLKKSIEEDLVVKAIADDEYQHRTRKESESSPRSPSSVRSLVQSIISPRIGQTSSPDWANIQVNVHPLNWAFLQ